MRLFLFIWMLVVFVGVGHAQSLPDSLRHQIEIRINSESAVAMQVKELLAINLIAAEATVVDHSKSWILDIAVSRSEVDSNFVAISMVASQPNLQPERKNPISKDTDLESGEWVKTYLANEYADGLTKIQLHEVVLTEAAILDAGARELVDRFKRRFLDSIKEMQLRRIQNN